MTYLKYDSFEDWWNKLESFFSVACGTLTPDTCKLYNMFGVPSKELIIKWLRNAFDAGRQTNQYSNFGDWFNERSECGSIAERFYDEMILNTNRNTYNKSIPLENWLVTAFKMGRAQKIQKNNTSTTDKVIELLLRARKLIIARGESTDMIVQFAQHAWLNEVNKLFPLIPEEN